MQQELLLFGRTFLAGACLAACYDILRILRGVAAHNAVWTGIEDILFGCASGLFLFSVIYRGNDGVIRIYVLAAVSFGIFLYHVCLSGFFVKYGVLILKKAGKILGIFGKPVRKWRKRLKLSRDRVNILVYKRKSILKDRKRENEKKRKEKPAK